MEKYPIYCGGEFVDTQQYLKIINPATGKLVAHACCGREEDFEMAVNKGIVLEKETARLPSYVRSDALLYIAQALENDKAGMAAILSLEAGKPVKLAVGEVERAIVACKVAAEEARRLPSEYLSIDWTPAGKGKEGWMKYFPVGLVAGISPFNFPLNLAMHKLAPAIASGCPIILKPSSTTPLSTLKLAHIIHETNLPKGMVSVIPFNRELGNRLVTDDRIKLISFTGSPDVGWQMKRDAGKKRVVLELGGNAGLIITPTADLEAAVQKSVAGAFSYAGQVCIHTQRIFVHESVFQVFSEGLINATRKLLPGDPLDPATDIAPMINEANAIRVENWVAEACAGGAALLAGGIRKGSFFQPTILSHTTPTMKVNACEVFGPVVTLEPYQKFEDAIDMVNNSSFGLQAGVFTDSLREMNLAFHELQVGGVIINDVPTFRVDHMPYGGIKNSGFGREGIKYAILDMMEARLLIKNT